MVRVVAAVVCVALAASAVALGAGKRQVIGGTTIQPGGSRAPGGTATLTCPAGKVPRNVGFASSFTTVPSDPSYETVVSSLVVDGPTLTASARNFGQQPGGVADYADCSRSLGHLQEVRMSARAGPKRPGSATATCPKGTEVLRGGFKTELNGKQTGPNVLVTGLARPSPRTWKVTGVGSPQDEKKGTITAIAYCGKGRQITPAKRTVSVPPDDFRHLTVSCPVGSKLLFGGFATTFSRFQAQIVPFNERKHQANWTVKGTNVGDGSAADLTAIAYCLG
jgi:hypothetical protein